VRLAGAQKASLWIRIRLAKVGWLAWLSRFYFRRTADYKIATYRNRIVRHSYCGHQFAVALEDPVAEDWYDHDWPVMPELACLSRSRLGQGARVFDLGAHQGVVALMLSRFVGSDGQVVAVESERHNFEVAVRNRDLNEVRNLEILHAAGGATEGSLYFRGGLNGTVASRGRVGLARVPALTVDGLAGRFGVPDVVFVDVEGFEQEVLRGAVDILAGGRTDFFVEVHVGYGLEDFGGSARSVLEHFDPGRFQLLVSPARSELEDYRFGALEDHLDLLANRFFLIALAKGDAVGSPSAVSAWHQSRGA
jgi:FkbM family methyltransferase